MKALIVDDSMMVRMQVKRALGSAGFEIVEASDGLDALEKLKANQDVQFIVLDVNMPKMSGIEFLEAFRHELPELTPAIVMLTTEGQPELIQRARALGVKGWIIKPFKAELMVAPARKLTQAMAAS